MTSEFVDRAIAYLEELPPDERKGEAFEGVPWSLLDRWVVEMIEESNRT